MYEADVPPVVAAVQRAEEKKEAKSGMTLRKIKKNYVDVSYTANQLRSEYYTKLKKHPPSVVELKALGYSEKKGMEYVFNRDIQDPQVYFNNLATKERENKKSNTNI